MSVLRKLFMNLLQMLDNALRSGIQTAENIGTKIKSDISSLEQNASDAIGNLSLQVKL